jgi:hypothetical protein
MVRRVLLAAVILLAALQAGAQDRVKFMGRAVTVTHPGTEDKDGMFPSGPATLCLEGAPRQCYTMPDKIGKNPHAEVVEIKPGLPALFFSAESGGTSGWGVHFALLRPGRTKYLQDLFLFNAEISNQGQHAFWNEPSVSESKIFVTADEVGGPDEAHYDNHRYIVSAYLRLPSTLLDGSFYYLNDQYMTVRKYDSDKHDVLAAEKPEILARLLRVKQQWTGVR